MITDFKGFKDWLLIGLVSVTATIGVAYLKKTSEEFEKLGNRFEVFVEKTDNKQNESKERIRILELQMDNANAGIQEMRKDLVESQRLQQEQLYYLEKINRQTKERE